jgi:hypothetical protein
MRPGFDGIVPSGKQRNAPWERSVADHEQGPECATLQARHRPVMRFWKGPLTVDILTAVHVDTAVACLGIERVEVRAIDCVSRVTMAILAPTQ